jgi:hypothetical protein
MVFDGYRKTISYTYSLLDTQGHPPYTQSSKKRILIKSSVFVSGDRIVYAGDMLFIGGTPIMWAGPVKNRIRAYDLMLDMEADSFVPGHGPIKDKKMYLIYVVFRILRRYR